MLGNRRNADFLDELAEEATHHELAGLVFRDAARFEVPHRIVVGERGLAEGIGEWAFYDAALEAGASPDGPPGPRPHYGEPYYGCFVRDLDGHKIEAAYWDAELVYELYIEPHEH